MTSPHASIPISATRVAALCGAAARHIAIRVVAETGSTNSDLLKAIPTLNGPMLLWAETQTAGKGRAGRSWQSAADATLTFSLAWRFTLPLQRLTGLPLAVGVTIAEVLRELGVRAQLKWPNDILRDGGKLAGILIETATEKNGNGIWAVIGIGINIAIPPQLNFLTDSSTNPGAVLKDVAQAEVNTPLAKIAAAPELDGDREQTMAMLTTALAAALDLFAQQGFAVFSERWNLLHAHAKNNVNIMDHGKILHQGIALGVDDSGALLLQTATGLVPIVAGDVSLRAA